MPKYLISGSYVGDGLKGLLKEGGTARKDAIGKLCADLGGHLEAAYFAFGTYDAHVIVDLPDNVTMAAISMVANATGAVQARTTVLPTAEELDEAAHTSIGYHPPAP